MADQTMPMNIALSKNSHTKMSERFTKERVYQSVKYIRLK